MLIMIYGEDTYQSREWLHELQSKFKSKFDAQGYSMSRFYGNADVGELRSAITAPPFLSARRMVVVERMFETQEKKESLEHVFQHIPESTIMIVWEEGGQKAFAKIPFFSQLLKRKETKVYAFPLLSGASLEAWARKRAKELNFSFERGALQILVARIGSDLWQLSGELEKFAALGKLVSVAMIEDGVRGNTPKNIFAFTDALSSQDARRAIRELKNEQENGVGVPYLLIMLARQFRILREARLYVSAHPNATATELAKTFAWHPFVAKKSLAQAQKFEVRELERACDLLFDAERFVKTGVLDADTAIDLLVTKLLETRKQLV